MAEDNIVNLIRERAIAAGVDPDMMLRIAKIESNLDPNARARTSSATGLFQVTGPTWRQFGAPGVDPRDPSANTDAAVRLTAANASGLRSAGFDPTPDNTYLAHFAGLGGARKILSSSPTAMVGDVLGADVVRANPFLANMTVADMRAWAGRKMGGAPATAARSAGTSQVPAVAGGGAAPSQTGAVPVDPQNAAGGNDELLRTLQMLSSPEQQPSMPAPPPLQVEDPMQQARIQRARALAVSMAQRPIT